MSESSRRVTLSGKPADPTYDGGAPQPINEKTGQHKDYWILSDEERAKGFKLPVRQSYKHLKCHAITKMSIKIAESCAADPFFYSGTFCVTCGEHFPLVDSNGKRSFVWINNDGTVGEPVGEYPVDPAHINQQKAQTINKLSDPIPFVLTPPPAKTPEQLRIEILSLGIESAKGMLIAGIQSGQVLENLRRTIAEAEAKR